MIILIILFIACAYAYRVEGFESPQIDSPVIEYPPNGPSPADVDTNHPYHLLSDRMAPRTTESLSCVNSRSCYATDFKRSIEKTGNYRQMTNNYKRNYPDNCSSWNQELTLAFYKME